ncbi:unnamed protein product [Closterium sp. NIES-64]|nr:unnamed protein product [Closterium sp. NIES-64]
MNFHEDADVEHVTRSPLVPLTVLADLDDDGAVCLDGSPPAIHLSPGWGRGANNWLIYLEGGGWCNSEEECAHRAATHLGSSKRMGGLMAFGGILSHDPTVNPGFYNWNLVFVRYCDGASYLGDANEPVQTNNGLVFFRGRRIFDAVTRYLVSHHGMGAASLVLLSGCSAGGLASLQHCDRLAEILQQSSSQSGTSERAGAEEGRAGGGAEERAMEGRGRVGGGPVVKCMGDAGFFLDSEDVGGVRRMRERFKAVVETQNVSLHERCTAAVAPQDHYLCFFPEHLLPFLCQPFFVLNPLYDSWQVSFSFAQQHAFPSLDWHHCRTDLRSCPPHLLQLLHGYHHQMVTKLSPFLPATHSLSPPPHHRRRLTLVEGGGIGVEEGAMKRDGLGVVEGEAFRSQEGGVSASASRNGALLLSCHLHCMALASQAWHGAGAPRVGGKTMAEAIVASAGQTVVTGPNNPAVNLDKAKGENGVATEVPTGIEKAAAAGGLDKFEGTTIVSPSTDSMLMVDVKVAGWNKMKCHKDLGKPGEGACTPANCSKGGIAAKWKTSNLLKNKLGVEVYVKGNPLTLKKASPQTCCNTCAGYSSCTYWQYIPDITIDGKKTEGACYLVHDNIDYSCGDMTAQYATDSKPVHLQVRTGGECNPAANVVNDPHLVGAYGTHFDFNGRPDKAFCLLTDKDLHVNMLLRGYYSDDTENAALVVDGKAVHTWIKELGIVWFANGADHKVRLAARSGKQQERGDGFMKTIEIDGEEIPRMNVGDEVTAEGGLTLRFAALEKEGPYDVDYYTLTIDGLVALDLRLRVANPKLQTPSEAEAHINVGIVELEHTDDVHGVLGQTYRPDHAARAADFQRLIANLHRPISADSQEGAGFLDGTPRLYESSSVLSVDCAQTEYHRAKQLSPVEDFPMEPLN